MADFRSPRLFTGVVVIVLSALACAACSSEHRGSAVAVEFLSPELKSAQTDFALERFDRSLKGSGKTLAEKAGQAGLVVSVVQVDPGNVGPEGFILNCRRPAGFGGDKVSAASKLKLCVSSSAGAMYGLLELSDLVRRGQPLTGHDRRKVEPAVDVRAIKLNLPYMSDRKGESLQLHHDTMKDRAFWRAFLDMMAENRFNTLTLWSLHPFHYFVRPSNFPEASPWSDAEMMEWKALWTDVLRMANERGIETFLVNWNTFVSPAFAKAHDVAPWSIDWRHYGSGTDSELVKTYTKEVVTQTINEYPGLTGLGVTLGERMGGQDADQRREWLDETFFAGIEAADRPIRFLYRAPLSANLGSGGSTGAENDRETRAQLERLKNVIDPVYVSFKFNGSHGHSTPKLYHVHGGTLSDAYWNPLPERHRVLWTIGNEDFFVLRWGDPDFIRHHIRENGRHDYVGGYIIGSEAYIPGKDYITSEGPHKRTRWAFERQWLFYSVWGQLLYNPATPDHLFETRFLERYPGIDAERLLAAWKLASKTPNRFASFFKGTDDSSLYTEGHLSWPEDEGIRFISVDRLIDRPVLDEDTFVGIREYVEGGDEILDGRMSPLDLAILLDRDADETGRLMDGLAPRALPTLQAELTDIHAWTAYARYFADQLRGGVALQRFRTGGDEMDRIAAIGSLTDAAAHWEELADLITRFNNDPLPFAGGFQVSWPALLEEARKDIEIARNAVYDPPEEL